MAGYNRHGIHGGAIEWKATSLSEGGPCRAEKELQQATLPS